jgi:hypothetical protein
MPYSWFYCLFTNPPLGGRLQNPQAIFQLYWEREWGVGTAIELKKLNTRFVLFTLGGENVPFKLHSNICFWANTASLLCFLCVSVNIYIWFRTFTDDSQLIKISPLSRGLNQQPSGYQPTRSTPWATCRPELFSLDDEGPVFKRVYGRWFKSLGSNFSSGVWMIRYIGSVGAYDWSVIVIIV